MTSFNFVYSLKFSTSLIILMTSHIFIIYLIYEYIKYTLWNKTKQVNTYFMLFENVLK